MIVLDTHVWVWWVSGAQPLPARVKRLVEQHRKQATIRVSSISVWEVAQLVKCGRLELTMDVADWVARSEALPFLEFVPVDNRVALRSTQLPGSLHADPADRIIVATTLAVGGTLVTKDNKLRRYRHVETLW
jgi:PIN domain nuclease of toxin-antitoxin system